MIPQVSILIFMLLKTKTSIFQPLHFGNYPFLVNHDNKALGPRSIFILNTVNAVIFSNFRVSLCCTYPSQFIPLAWEIWGGQGDLLGSSLEFNKDKVLKTMNRKP